MYNRRDTHIGIVIKFLRWKHLMRKLNTIILCESCVDESYIQNKYYDLKEHLMWKLNTMIRYIKRICA